MANNNATPATIMVTTNNPVPETTEAPSFRISNGARLAANRLGIRDEHIERVLDDPDVEANGFCDRTWLSRGNVTALVAESADGTDFVLMLRAGSCAWRAREVDGPWLDITPVAREWLERLGYKHEDAVAAFENPDERIPAMGSRVWFVRGDLGVLVAEDGLTAISVRKADTIYRSHEREAWKPQV